MQPATNAQPAPQSAERAAILERLATALEENFVRPDVGSLYAAALRTKAASASYGEYPNARAFADAVTADLQAVHPDGHLRLRAPDALAAAGGQPMRSGPGLASAIGESGWLAEGVAYVDFSGFPGNSATLDALRRFLTDHSNARVLIIDARHHRGGGMAEMDMMFPYLFAQETELLRMDTRVAVEERGASPLEDGPSLRRISGVEGVVRRAHFAIPTAEATPLRNTQLFLLTSRRTASAGEHLALSLKRTRRATLIGETTRGAGNYGGFVEVGGGFAAFIPVGRTFDPDTGEGWEGVGVTPHVQVPADQALDEALRRAGVDPAERRQLTPAA